jgi:hypothetical protein
MNNYEWIINIYFGTMKIVKAAQVGGRMGLFERALGLLKGGKEDAVSEKPGRNEPCWCGSGRKYKKCHLTEDDKETKKACSLNCGPT